MTTRTLAAALAAVALTVPAAPVVPADTAAAATSEHFSGTDPIGPVHYDAEPFFPCSVAGTTTGTVRWRLAVVDRGEAAGFHSTWHENFTATNVPDDPALPTTFTRGNLTETRTLTRGGLTVFTVTNHDNARGADGEWLRVRGLYHVTYQDNEPFGPSDSDVVRTEVNHFSFGCSWAEGISG